MSLFFEVREGPNRGLRAPVTVGLQIGRSVAYGLRLKDTKVSAIHAEVHLDEDGQLVLIDKGSTNLIKTAEGRVESVRIFEGLTFKIGSTRFHVMAETEEKKSAVENQEDKKSERPEWRQLLVDYFRSSDLRLHKPKASVSAFSPPLEIEIVQGSQLGTIWTLGYGPREFGKICADLTIWDETCADIAFQISSSDQGEPSIDVMPGVDVKLNDQDVFSEKLSDGDLIQTGQTILKIRFL